MKRTEFQVIGRGRFPVDMLRYDCCWPKSGEDCEKMAAALDRTTEQERHKIMMVCVDKPTVDRWRSFLWTVVQEGSPLWADRFTPA